MTEVILDRFEGQWAVLERENQRFNIPRDILPNEAKEGDVLELTLTLNAEQTKASLQKNQKLLEQLMEE